MLFSMGHRRRGATLWLTVALVSTLALSVFTGAASAATTDSYRTVIAAGKSSSMARLITRQRDALATRLLFGPTDIECWTGRTIQSAENSLFVSAELSYDGPDYAMLRARATAIGRWERFSVCRDRTNGLTTIASEANGRLVTAEPASGGDRTGMLRARGIVAGPWQYFYTSARPGGSVTTIRSAANDRLVSAELRYTGRAKGMLRARASRVGNFERFMW
jgi:hypothetical protein